jgi:FdhE protein
MTQHILEPGEIQGGAAPDIPPIRLPRRNAVFSERAARLRQLAPEHALGDYLQFIAKVADAQHHALTAMSGVKLPDAGLLEQARLHGMPPLNAQDHVRDPAWRLILRQLLGGLDGEVDGVARDLVRRLAAETDVVYDAQAARVLGGVTAGLDMAYAPLIAAGLQVYWVHQVTALGISALALLDVPTVCPACGTRPVASIARSGGPSGGHRYLHCALCATEWHMVRIKCSDCESTSGINYYAIDGGTPAVKAESCDACAGYLKIFYMEKDAQVEPTADDLASTALDLLMAEAGKLRSGPNLMLFAGDSE